MVRPAAEEVTQYKSMTAAERQRALERISIRTSIENLLTFPCVRILHERQKITLSGAWFDISNGELWVMNPQTGDFSRPYIHNQ